MELIEHSRIHTLHKSGVFSEQLICPENSESERVTITRVTILPGAMQVRHKHERSEQIWIALKGHGRVLLGDAVEQELYAGDVVRFEAKELHGLSNNGPEEFVYLAVTSPPIDFRPAY